MTMRLQLSGSTLLQHGTTKQNVVWSSEEHYIRQLRDTLPLCNETAAKTDLQHPPLLGRSSEAG